MSETGSDKVAPEEIDVLQAEHFNMMPPEDELEWLRGQYVELRGMLDSARQKYSSAGQEAAALRRSLASRAPTVRERTAIAIFTALLTEPNENNLQEDARCAVIAADALVAALEDEGDAIADAALLRKLEGGRR